ncbi:uncharacterized protein LOC124442034 isoform X1 [Xenia sp. Carnegie-2017]|uniref:uncharacterized protein LOC124442034 isoform X1 n=1 Tax=Xenia sp. Carnegie-2017 TaxID=2897299 RepID=UPI001F048E7C|nr:uncharacterized protein LOC124442034 isoform X1 [Xenia sp. Carnegie-2017]
MPRLCCQVCATIFSTSVAGMLHHLVAVHEHDARLHILCEVPECNSTFAKVNSYKSHLRRKHANVDLNSRHLCCVESASSTHNNFCPDEDGLELLIDEFNRENELDDSVQAMEHKKAQFLLKTKEINLLTQKCVDNIVEDSTELVQGTVKAIKHGLQNCLEKAGLNYNDVPGLDELFDEGHAISNPFKHISTKYKQNAYFEEHFGLVQPRRIKLGHRVVKRRSRTVYKEVIKDDEIMYIPLLKSLEKMLNVKGVLEQVRLLIAWLCFFLCWQVYQTMTTTSLQVPISITGLQNINTCSMYNHKRNFMCVLLC